MDTYELFISVVYMENAKCRTVNGQQVSDIEQALPLIDLRFGRSSRCVDGSPSILVQTTNCLMRRLPNSSSIYYIQAVLKLQWLIICQILSSINHLCMIKSFFYNIYTCFSAINSIYKQRTITYHSGGSSGAARTQEITTDKKSKISTLTNI